MDIKALRAQLAAALIPVREIAAKAETEDRDFTADERAEIGRRMTDAEGIKAKIKQAEGDDELRKSIADLDGIGHDPAPDRHTPDALWTPSKRGETVGDAFIASTQYKNLLATAPNGRFGDKQRVQSEPFGVKALVTGLSDTSAGAFVQNDNIGLQVGLGAFQRPFSVRQVITNGTTGSDTVEYVRVTSITNAAAATAEATTSALPTAPGGAGALVNAAGGGYKPESALALAKVTETVRTIAHWLPATKRALSDAGQVRTLIDQFLRYGLEEELEDLIITGNGVGENFTGLANTSGVQTQAFTTNLLTTYRLARTLVRTVGRSVPTAYVLNPVDWQNVDLLQNNEGNYYFGGPSVLGTPRLWGLPVIESEAAPAGTAYVADWRKAVLWDREQSSITVSDSHADFFVRNLVAILAEMRAAFGVLQPNAFVKIALS